MRELRETEPLGERKTWVLKFIMERRVKVDRNHWGRVWRRAGA